jgi:hypothetical protein
MPQWDNKQFEQKAQTIAKTALAKGGDLHTLTIKEAKASGLNEEQIRRLGRAVNVKAFEEKFASLKGRPDRIVEFDPVDPENVISELFTTAPVAEKRASAAYPNLSDQMRDLRGWAPAEQTKVASINVRQEMDRLVPKEPPIEAQISHWTKVAEDLRTRRAGAEIRWDDSMATIKSHSQRLYWDRDEFEKDAVALYGDEVLFELNALRADARLPALELDASTATKLAAQLFGEETEDTKLLKKAAVARVEYAQFSQAEKAATAKLAELRKKVLG